MMVYSVSGDDIDVLISADVYTANEDGSDVRRIVSYESGIVRRVSIYNINTICWGTDGKQRWNIISLQLVK